MIPADEALYIMQQHEDAYDNFLDKLRSKTKAKQQAAQQAQAQAKQSEQKLKQAESSKRQRLGQKAKDLVERAGGIEGIARTVQNVTKYFKDDTPSDYDLSFGKEASDAAAAEKKIMGMPAMAVYIGGTILLLGGLFVAAKLLSKPALPPVPQGPNNPSVTLQH